MVCRRSSQVGRCSPLVVILLPEARITARPRQAARAAGRTERRLLERLICVGGTGRRRTGCPAAAPVQSQTHLGNKCDVLGSALWKVSRIKTRTEDADPDPGGNKNTEKTVPEVKTEQRSKSKDYSKKLQFYVLTSRKFGRKGYTKT